MLADEQHVAEPFALKAFEDTLDRQVVAHVPRKNWNRWSQWGVIGLLGLIPVGAIVISASQTRLETLSTSPERTTVAKALPVSVTAVESVSSFETMHIYTGEIVAGRSSELGFEQGGTIVELLVDEGETVQQGERLGRLDTRSLQAQKEQLLAQRTQAQAQLTELKNGARSEDIAAARGNIEDLERQIELAQLKTQRRQELYEEGAISLETFDQERLAEASLQSRLAIAQSNLEQLLNGTRPEQITAQAAQVQQLDAQIKQVDIQISKSQLFAPFSGIVGDRLVDPGTVVGAGSPVFRLLEGGLPEAHIGVSPEVAATLPVGSTQQLEVGEQGFKATIVSLLPELDPTSRTVTAILQIENSPPLLRAGETAKLTLTETQQMEGFWLDSTALIPSERGLWSVFAISESSENGLQASRRDVEVLHTEGDRSLVRGLLQEGDRIITSGTHRLVNGQTVQIH